MNEQLSPLVQRFVLHFGEMGSRWGINRTVGQIYALLYLSPRPLNADAIGEAQGHIEIEIECVRRPDDAADETPAWICLSVSDNGEGMTPEVRERVFDPFFTTKEPGKGSGLGLSVIHGLVGKLGGHIQLDSAQGRGSRFVIELPRLIQEAETTLR